MDVATSSSLTFNNALNLNGNTLTKMGGGTLLINNVLNAGGGTVTGLAGVLGGSGTVGGDVVISGGSLSPGSGGGAVSSVPEPSTMLLLALGATALAYVRR